MDNFKIKSIDEFDLDFVAGYNKKSDNEISSVSTNGPIPEIAKEESINISYADTADSDEQTFAPAAQNAPFFSAQAAAKPQTYVPAGAPADRPAPVNQKNQPAKAKQSAVAIVGKVISIILLAATIIVFVLGCFVTIFLDNHGSELFGICFNTVSTDTYDPSTDPSTDDPIVSKGDLIISQKADASEYTTGKMIAVKSSSTGEDYYSDIHVVTSVLSVSSDSAEITTVNISSPGNGTSTLSSKDTYGVVDRKISGLGTILHFAMDNAVLICVLFVLLAALWCLILVLIENQRNKTKKQNK